MIQVSMATVNHGLNCRELDGRYLHGHVDRILEEKTKKRREEKDEQDHNYNAEDERDGVLQHWVFDVAVCLLVCCLIMCLANTSMNK